MTFRSTIPFTSLALLLFVPPTAADFSPVGVVSCNRPMEGRRVLDQHFMLSASIQPTRQGFELLMADPVLGAYVFHLDDSLMVQSAGTLESNTVSPWELDPTIDTSAQIAPDGAFTVEVAHSDQSFCNFSGTVTFLDGAADVLFGN